MTQILVLLVLIPLALFGLIESGYQRRRAKLAEADRDWWKQAATIIGQTLDDAPDYASIKRQWHAHAAQRDRAFVFPAPPTTRGEQP